MWTNVFSQTYIFNQGPIYEFYSKNSENTFENLSSNMQSAYYHPQIDFELTRNISSHFTSLFLPIRAYFSIGKSFEKDGDLFLFLRSYSFVYETRSINLFGEFGAYPVFKFYKIDELINLFEMNLLYEDNGDLRTGEFSLNNILTFEGKNANLFTIENYLSLTRGEEHLTSETIIIGYNWFRYPEDGVRLPFLKEKIRKTGFVSHDERFSLTWEKDNDEDNTFNPVTFLFTHETAIRYPEYGYFRGEISLGLDTQSMPGEDERENLYRIVFRLGIEVRIEF